jgi:hypothetical protein
MLAPSVLGTESVSLLAVSDRLVGALVVTVALLALAEVARPLRLLNVPIGALLIAAPWLLGGGLGAATWNDVAVGIALIALSLPLGTVRERYGGWNRYIR